MVVECAFVWIYSSSFIIARLWCGWKKKSANLADGLKTSTSSCIACWIFERSKICLVILTFNIFVLLIQIFAWETIIKNFKRIYLYVVKINRLIGSSNCEQHHVTWLLAEIYFPLLSHLKNLGKNLITNLAKINLRQIQPHSSQPGQQKWIIFKNSFQPKYFVSFQHFSSKANSKKSSIDKLVICTIFLGFYVTETKKTWMVEVLLFLIDANKHRTQSHSFGGRAC